MKQTLKNLIAAGKTEHAIKQLLETTQNLADIDLEQQVITQSAFYSKYRKEQILGTRSGEQESIALAKINQALLSIIDQLPEGISITISKESSKPQIVHTPEKDWWKYITGAAVILGIFGGLAEVFNFINIFPAEPIGTSQITVYVHGTKGKQNYVLENAGELLLDLDGDRRFAKIGEKGRTVFNEIPLKFKGKKLPITVIADGFESTKTNSLYKWEDQAIYYPIRRDASLLIIKGIVKNREGLELLSNVLVLIENEWTTTTDSLGRFSFSLTEDQVKKKYNLSFQKEGYQSESEYYYPNSSKEFRLRKNQIQ